MPRLGVLVVDDLPEIRELVAEILASEGYRPFTAGCANEALMKMTAVRPNLIITDLSMPGMDGIDLIAQARGRSETATVPAIVITAQGRHAADARLAQAGIQALVLPKPFEVDDLLRAVAGCLRPAWGRRTPELAVV